MARTEYGLSLAIPVLKPGSTVFALTQAGFDTGTRTFQIDEDELPDALPELESADTDLRWTDAARTTVRGGNFGTMYVSSVGNITEGKNGICEYTVSFLGLIKREKRVFETVQSQTIPFRGDVSGNLKYGFYDSAPVVPLTYVSKTFPDMTQLGKNIIPPGWSEPTPPAIVLDGVTVPSIKSAYWILREREFRHAGGRKLFEIRDQYAYEIVR